MKKILFCIVFIVYCLLQLPSVYAAYVLPYPSFMPGNRLYPVMRLLDEMKRYWYWGTVGSIKNNMMLSDKDLVEAKTLFEYKQYVLALDALNRSNKNIRRLHSLVLQSEQEKKDISSWLPIIQEDMLVHQSILNTLRNQLPIETLWQPEKQPSVLLPLHQSLDIAIEQRKNLIQINEP